MQARWSLLPSVIFLMVSASVAAQGLPPLGPPSGGLGSSGGLTNIDPKAMAFEMDLLAQINALRSKQKRPSMTMDNRLRLFARKEAELAARGDPGASNINERIKTGGYAPYGYWVQSLYGANVRDVLAAMRKDKGMRDAVLGEFDKAGLGAFYVPEDPPYFQVTAIMAKSPDPMAGQTGLSTAQTDPVMKQAMTPIQECYNHALERNPNLQGSALAKIVIGGDGTVTEASMLNSLGETMFDACILTVINALKFPRPYKGKPVTLNHPMRFAPPHGSKKVGRLSASQIESTFGRARHGFFTCYESRLRKKPKLAGTVQVSLVVQPDGRATSINITENTTGDQALGTCIKKRSELLRFPPPQFGGPVNVTYPLNFAPPKKS